MTPVSQLSLMARADGYEPCGLAEANVFLTGRHYLGSCPPMGVRLVFGQFADGALVAVQVWRKPASRRLPSDGTWWELLQIDPDHAGRPGMEYLP